ncbi:F-box protein [Chlorogloeopsis fritschii PCC 9212]|nr:hypothetical protein [Chlorogloeopsis fritschii C42_A2020_084]
MLKLFSQVFSRLPFNSHLQFRTVCTCW